MYSNKKKDQSGGIYNTYSMLGWDLWFIMTNPCPQATPLDSGGY